MSSQSAATDVSQPRRTKAINVALWTVQILVASFLAFGGVLKLAGAAEMVALFEEIGIGQWFRYVTGVLEVTGGVMLVIPHLAVIGATILTSVMAGAVVTHLFVVGGSSLLPLLLLILLLVIVWARRDDLAFTLRSWY